MAATNVSNPGSTPELAHPGASTALQDVARPDMSTGQIGDVSIELHQPSILQSLRDARRNLPMLGGLFGMVLGFQMTNTVLGVWWVPITFVFDTFVKTFIFGGVLNAPSPSGIPYFLFLAAGNAGWFLFHRGTLYSMKSFQRLRHFVNAFDFPLLFIPLVGVFQMIGWLGFSLVIMAGGFVVFWFLDGQLYLNVSPELILAPIGLLWIGLVTVSWGLFSAPIYYRARDIRQIYKMALPFVMYITPVIYPISAVPGGWKVAAQLNPLAAPIELFKQGLLGTGSVPIYSVASSLGVTVLLLMFGLWFMNRYSLRLVGVGPVEDEDYDE